MPNPASDFPAAVHSPTNTSAFSATALGSTGPVHTAVHGKVEQELVSTQTKLGTGASTPTAGKVMRATGTGTSAWGPVDLTTDVTAILTVPNGGTGVATLTGILKGNGTGAFTAAAAGTDYYNPGGTDVAVVDGGTGSSTAGGARTNLGVTKNFYTVGAADADYITDGTADNVQIQAAIDAATAAGGGIVHIKAQSTGYDIAAALTFKNNVIIEGDGSATVLKYSGTGAGIFYSSSTTSVDHAGIRDIKLDANAVNTSICLYLRKFTDFLVENVTAYNTSGGWAVLLGSWDTNEATSKSKYLTVRNLTVDTVVSTSLEPMLLVNTDYYTIDNCTFVNCNVTLTASLSIYLNSRNGAITNNNFIDAVDQRAQLNLTGADNVNISGNKFKFTGTDGSNAITLINVQFVTIKGNTFNNVISPSGFGGIQILVQDFAGTLDGHTNPHVNSSDIVISGNTFIGGYSVIQFHADGADKSYAQSGVVISDNYAEQYVYTFLQIDDTTRLTGAITDFSIANNVMKPKASGDNTIMRIKGNVTYPLNRFVISGNLLYSSGTGNADVMLTDYLTYSSISGNRLYAKGTGKPINSTNDDSLFITDNYGNASSSIGGTNAIVSNNSGLTDTVGGGNVTGQASSVDSEIALFSGTGGKTIKRATSTGILKGTSGVLSAVTAPSGALVGDTDTQNLTNKTIDGTNTITAKDSTFTIQDNSDPTKLAQFQIGGNTTGTTRTYTMPNSNSTLASANANSNFSAVQSFSTASQAVILSGAPGASATQALFRIGNTLVGGDATTDGGTYFALNLPNSGAGSVADMVNFQKNGSTLFKITNSGIVTAILGDSTAVFGNVSDTTKVLKTSLGGATTAKTMTLVSSHTDNRSVTLPDATDTLVGKATTDTLTNKTLTSPTINGGTINRLSTAGQLLISSVMTPLASGFTGAANTTEQEVTGLRVSLPMIGGTCLVKVTLRGWYTVGTGNSTLRIRAGTNGTFLSNTERDNVYVGSAKTIETIVAYAEFSVDLTTQTYVVVSMQNDVSLATCSLSSAGNRTFVKTEIYA